MRRQTMAMVLTAVALLPFAVGCEEKAKTGPKQSDSRTFEFSGDRLKVVGIEADVQIDVGSGSGIQVSRTVRGEVAKGSGWSMKDGVLTLKAVCGGVVLDCSAKYSVKIPSATAVELEGSGSSIKVSGLREGLTARLRADASLRAEKCSGTMRVTSDGGDITVSRSSSARLTATAANDGNIKLAFDAAPRQVVARTYGGSITVVVPGTETYRVDAKGDGGDRLRSDPSSSRTITAIANDGRVVVRRK
ncbi:Domain of unknown function [Micromonospora nigra]|uniref:Adhesin n=1 Tax=Micromonospora nigra TaxID=145857 RepID=A0A1C6SG72_9ACTN|nr:hypothetical protein [Micromonospora nigra]SCL28427.1 Domain of unknown function [Micromonospora nigra]